MALNDEGGSLLVFDGRRGYAFPEVLVEKIPRNVVEANLTLIVHPPLHLAHGLFRLIFALILDEHVSRVGADFLLLDGNKPVVNNRTELREALEQIFFILVPLLFSQLPSHVGCDAIFHSDDCGCQVVAVLEVVD
jgi:hypothetical protein